MQSCKPRIWQEVSLRLAEVVSLSELLKSDRWRRGARDEPRLLHPQDSKLFGLVCNAIATECSLEQAPFGRKATEKADADEKRFGEAG